MIFFMIFCIIKALIKFREELKMAVSCVTTPLGNFYSVTDSGIVHLLQNYIGYGGSTLLDKAEELSITELTSQFDIFYKDIKRVLYENFKVKKKIAEYDDRWLANEIIGYISGDDDNYYRNSLISILKVLEHAKDEIKLYNNEMLNRVVFGGEASYLHLLLLHIEEFAGQVATIKEKKDYNRIHSRKRLLAQEVYDLARRLPKSQTYTNEMTHIYECIFFIRQAIELKVLESLFIGSVVNKRCLRPVKISPDMFIGLLDDEAVKLRNINGEDRVLDVDLIKKAHSWTNTFVHSGCGYWFWEVEFIRLTLQDFIFGNIEIDKEYLRQIPERILQYVKEEEREDAEVIMTKRYHELLA